MSFNAEDFRGDLLSLIEEVSPFVFPLHFTEEDDFIQLLDGIDFLLLSGDEDWVDTVGHFLAKFSEQLAAKELGRERLAEWLPILAKSKHYDVHDDVAQICEVLIPQGPK